jgi:hypothetical protein
MYPTGIMLVRVYRSRLFPVACCLLPVPFCLLPIACFLPRLCYHELNAQQFGREPFSPSSRKIAFHVNSQTPQRNGPPMSKLYRARLPRIGAAQPKTQSVWQILNRRFLSAPGFPAYKIERLSPAASAYATSGCRRTNTTAVAVRNPGMNDGISTVPRSTGRT